MCPFLLAPRLSYIALVVYVTHSRVIKHLYSVGNVAEQFQALQQTYFYSRRILPSFLLICQAHSTRICSIYCSLSGILQMYLTFSPIFLYSRQKKILTLTILGVVCFLKMYTHRLTNQSWFLNETKAQQNCQLSNQSGPSWTNIFIFFWSVLNHS